MVQWFHGLFGDDYYLELQRHKATVLNANHEVYQLQTVSYTHLDVYKRQQVGPCHKQDRQT